MSAKLPDVFRFVDENISTYVVERFHGLRENGLFLDVTIHVSCLCTVLFSV